jgi:hypothetical protein
MCHVNRKLLNMKITKEASCRVQRGKTAGAASGGRQYPPRPGFGRAAKRRNTKTSAPKAKDPELAHRRCNAQFPQGALRDRFQRLNEFNGGVGHSD